MTLLADNHMRKNRAYWLHSKKFAECDTLNILLNPGQSPSSVQFS